MGGVCIVVSGLGISYAEELPAYFINRSPKTQLGAGQPGGCLVPRPPHPAFCYLLFVLQATQAGHGGLGTRLAWRLILSAFHYFQLMI